jgi:hypothetical protein
MTCLTLGLSIPIPKAIVAITTCTFSLSYSLRVQKPPQKPSSLQGDLTIAYHVEVLSYYAFR